MPERLVRLLLAGLMFGLTFLPFNTVGTTWGAMLEVWIEVSGGLLCWPYLLVFPVLALANLFFAMEQPSKKWLNAYHIVLLLVFGVEIFVTLILGLLWDLRNSDLKIGFWLRPVVVLVTLMIEFWLGRRRKQDTLTD